jgi:hypothetical protein
VVTLTRPVPVYWLVVGMAVMILSPLLSIFASVQIAERNAERSFKEQQRAQAAAQAQSRAVACSFFGASLDVYDETPPISATGRNLREKYVDLYTLTGCQPPRK